MRIHSVLKVYILGAGGNTYHVIDAEKSLWNPLPTLNGRDWVHRAGGVLQTFKVIPQSNLQFVKPNKGHLFHAITFTNGKVVYV